MIRKKVLDELRAKGWRSVSTSYGYFIRKCINGKGVILFLDKVKGEKDKYSIRHKGPVKQYFSTPANFTVDDDIYRVTCTGSILSTFIKMINSSGIANSIDKPLEIVVNNYYKHATRTGRQTRLDHMLGNLNSTGTVRTGGITW